MLYIVDRELYLEAARNKSDAPGSMWSIPYSRICTVDHDGIACYRIALDSGYVIYLPIQDYAAVTGHELASLARCVANGHIGIIELTFEFCNYNTFDGSDLLAVYRRDDVTDVRVVRYDQVRFMSADNADRLGYGHRIMWDIPVTNEMHKICNASDYGVVSYETWQRYCNLV